MHEAVVAHDGPDGRGVPRASFCAALFLACGVLLQLSALVAQSQSPPVPFAWPEGRRAALSLTFDDARTSQIDTGLPLLNGHGVKATFYIQPEGVRRRLEGWKAAVASGHEIGNHTISHPCTGNYAFSSRNALEDYTLERMDTEIVGANEAIRRDLGVSPVSFAYPCGQTFVGRGLDVRSYVPLVARAFRTGRGYLGEAANDPAICDPAQLVAVGLDGLSWDAVLALLEKATAESRWLIFAGHEIGNAGFQTTRLDTLDALCRYARDPAHGIWLDTVDAVASHVLRSRRAVPSPSHNDD
jgi:peptidoglycan/xylan/chitin deacetylase (PgdA/CDA1 family)